MAGLVAELRRTLADPEQPETRCARPPPAGCAGWPETDVHGRRRPERRPGDLVGPARGHAAPTGRSGPTDEPVTLSASALEGLLTCPAQWFLQREAGGEVVSSTSQGFGKVVHALAERVATGELGRTRRPT